MIDWGQQTYILGCIESFAPNAVVCCPISQGHDVRRYCFGGHAIEARRPKRQPLLDGSTHWDGAVEVVHGRMLDKVFLEGNMLRIQAFEDVEATLLQLEAFLRASCVQRDEWGAIARLAALLEAGFK